MIRKLIKMPREKSMRVKVYPTEHSKDYIAESDMTYLNKEPYGKIGCGLYALVRRKNRFFLKYPFQQRHIEEWNKVEAFRESKTPIENYRNNGSDQPIKTL